MSESDIIVLLARALKCSKGTQCTQLINRHTQNELRMCENRTGPVYCQIDKDRLSHDVSNIYQKLVLTNTYIFKYIAS